jgi:hypothetical protein
MVQSIGGGGGRAIAALEADDLSLIAGSTITVGGTDQADSAGGDIDYVQDGTIFSLGDFSIGGLIQSVGGGGGVVTATYSQVADSALQAMALPESSVVPAGGISAISSVTLGANGGAGNDGGSVSQTLSGGAMASGDHSTALILQSIGAGGGVVTLSGDDHPQISLGGTGGAQGSGGDVTLTNDGVIGTEGVGGYAVVLQSIGGGGGAVFGDFTGADIALNSDNAGDGGDIAFAQIGDITALGDKSIAILAQSLGGGGGFVEGLFAGTAGGLGVGGAVTLDVDGSIIAYGVDSIAVLAQSLGSLGGGEITLISTGDIRGGSGSGIGVSFDGGADNLIDTSGTLSAVSGLAIKTTYGNDTVENRGVIDGNAFLGEGTNLIHNNVGATYFTIDTLDLQDGSGHGAFVNDGTLELGLRASAYPIDLLNGATFAVPTYDDIRTAPLYGTAVISQVALDGDFSQSATGEMWYDVAFGPYASDRIDATGDATVDGTAHITLTWLENNDPVTLIATGGKATDLGMDVPDTIALDYRILADTAGIQLAFDSDFGQPFLNPNEQQLGHHMDSALEHGGAAGIGRLLALLGNLTAGQEDVYRAIFDELDPESLLAPTIENLDSARDFSKRVMGCDPHAGADSKTCMWGRAEYHVLNRDSGDGDYPIDLDGSARLRGGAAIAVADGWSLGAALGYDSLGDLTVGNHRATGDDGEAIHVGVGVTKAFGPEARGSAGLNLAAGWQSMRMERRQDIFEPLVGTSRVRSHYLAADANLGYSFGSGSWFIRPNVDASAIRLTLSGFDEDGLDGMGMRVDRSSDWFLSVEPKLTLGARMDRVHFSVTGGAMVSNKGVISAPMRFLGSDLTSDSALIRTMIDKHSFIAGAELGVDAAKGLDLSIGYQGYLGSRIDSHTANIRLRYSF